MTSSSSLRHWNRNNINMFCDFCFVVKCSNISPKISPPTYIYIYTFQKIDATSSTNQPKKATKKTPPGQASMDSTQPPELPMHRDNLLSQLRSHWSMPPRFFPARNSELALGMERRYVVGWISWRNPGTTSKQVDIGIRFRVFFKVFLHHPR